MNEYIQIENLGPIKKARIEIKPITILIGDNATGKSTIAKTIAALFDRDAITNYILKKDNNP